MEMGFEFEVLKDKKTLKELVALGGIVAGAYAFCKVLNFTGNMTKSFNRRNRGKDGDGRGST